MPSYRKFFDKDGKEVADPKDAVKCHEITTDDSGQVVSDAWYYPKEEK